MAMKDDLRLLVTMLNNYLDGDVPLPRAFIFSAITDCRHGADDHDDLEHAMAHDESDPHANQVWDHLVDYILYTAEEYQSANLSS